MEQLVQKRRDEFGLREQDRSEKEREKPLVKDLNDHIICPLCRGYLIDATTLVECLHSFCRGCIIRRLNGGPKVCPVCSASATGPLTPDVALQRLVYLVVPGLYKSEQERRKHFCQVNPQCINQNQSIVGAPDLNFDDLVSLSLSEIDSTSEGSTRYLKCPAGVTIRHLVRLLMLKRGWYNAESNGIQNGNNKIDVMYDASGSKSKKDLEVLDSSWTLMDLSCIFEWKREAPMKLLYRITRVDEPVNKSTCDSLNSITNNCNTNTDSHNQAIENIQRPPTPPPSPKLPISRTDSLNKSSRPPPTTVVDQYLNSKDSEPKKPRCEVTPVMRAPDLPVTDKHSKSEKSPKLEHPHKRKKRRNKRVIAEITTPREDLLKLKVRLTPVPTRVTSSTGNGNQSTDKLMQIRPVKKEKTKNIQKHRSPKEHKTNSKLEVNKIDNEEDLTKSKKPEIKENEKIEKNKEIEKVEINPIKLPETIQPTEKEETPKNEEVLRRLGLVAISEANKTRQERQKSPAQSNAVKNDPAVEREKLEKQLRESKANRKRSLLAEKQLRDTLKSIMSNSKDTNLTVTTTPSTPTSSTSRSSTPTTNNAKRKEPPPLTPIRNAKRPSVTFAPTPFPSTKYESPLDLSGPINLCKDNALDLSSAVTEVTISKCNPEEKLVGILRTSSNKTTSEKSKEEPKKSQDTNLRTLSDAAVSRIDNRTVSYAEKVAKLSQNVLRVPQPYQRMAGFGLKIKPNIGVRHIPNPQAVVASQYRNQRTGYFNVAHQPP